MQLQWYVSDCVREIPAYDDAAGLCVGGDGGDVKELAAVVLNTWEKKQGSRGGVGIDDGEDVGGGQVGSAGVWWVEFDEGGGRMEVVMVELRLYSILQEG